MRRRLAVLMVTGVCASALVLPAPTLAVYTSDTFRFNEWTSQATTAYCVPATTQMWTNHLKGLSDHTKATQDAYYNFGRTKNKYPLAAGVDPRGTAWILAQYTTGFGFNDYKTATEPELNNDLVLTIRNGGSEGIVFVAKGDHVVNVTGFQATADPNANGGLTAFYVSDPWSPRADPSNLTGGPYGFAPDHLITLKTWNDNYLYKYDESSGSAPFWDGSYVAVMRTSVNQLPRDNPSPPYGTGASLASLPEVPAEPTSATVEGAIITGLKWTGAAERNAWGLDLSSVTAGNRIHVDSLTSDIPSYELVDLKVQGRVVAVALVSIEGSQYQLGVVRKVTDQYRAQDAGAASVAFARAGRQATSVRAVWGWSEASMSPFMPMWVGRDSTNGLVVLTPGGSVVREVRPAPGFSLQPLR